MKRILSLAVFALLVLCSSSFAAVTTATFGDYNSSGVYRLTADSDGVLTYAQDTGIKYPYIATATTNTTLTAAQSGTTVVFGNGSGVAKSGTMYTLPTAVVGMEYTIVSDVAFFFYVDPQSTDTINYSTAAAGNRISNSSAAAGDSITLFCATAGKWSIAAKSGTWVVGPGQ